MARRLGIISGEGAAQKNGTAELLKIIRG